MPSTAVYPLFFRHRKITILPVRDIPSVPTHASGFNDYSAPGWVFLLRKASNHAGCFEFVDVNKIRRQRMITGFVEKNPPILLYG
nr:MAG TPA: hypothetical protein [Caudoviricetes sp.]